MENHYFFCGIGGSGMLPLALIVQEKGACVAGSDRALDQGRTAQKFEFLRARGIALFPQDGSGVENARQTVVISAAVEETVPDVVAAHRVGAQIITRAELLAQLFNAAPLPVGIAGTSGKSTTTGMLGWILHSVALRPTIMNGAVMKNFVTPSVPFAGAVVGQGEIFVSEVDESDGSIARYRPRVGIVTNVAFDHKSLEELQALFGEFVAKSEVAVLNLDSPRAAALAVPGLARQVLSFSLVDDSAYLFGTEPTLRAGGISFEVRERDSGARAHVALTVPGLHNVQNALAAIAGARACNVALAEAAAALERFEGLRRRFETVGSVGGVTVIDDFAHNPDKIAATLLTAHAQPGRLFLFFQPHGFGPLKLMRNELVDAFATGMRADDVLFMPDPIYFGGTTERSVTSKDIVEALAARGRRTHAIADRAECGDALVAEARSGDRIIVMGARDDTLATFAGDLVRMLEARPASPPLPRESAGVRG